jgi:hypothetical protein
MIDNMMGAKVPAFNVRTYGADPNGTDDSTAAFVKAFTKARNEGVATVYAPAGTYLLSFSGNELEMASGMHMVGDGIGRTILNGATVVDSVIYAPGSYSSEYSLTADCEPGEWSVKVSTADAANFAIGDLVLVGSDKRWAADYYSSQSTDIGQISRVVEVSGSLGLIFLDEQIYGDLPGTTGYDTADSAYIRKITPISDCMVSGMTIISGADTTYGATAGDVDLGYGIYARLYENFQVRDVEVISGVGFSAMLDVGVDATLKDMIVRENPVYGTLPGGGTEDSITYVSRFGIGLHGASRGTEITSSRFSEVFNGIVCWSGSGEGVSRFLDVNRCHFYNMRGWGGLDTHISMDHIRISDCSFLGKRNVNIADTNYDHTSHIRFSYCRQADASDNMFYGGMWAIEALAVQDLSVEGARFDFTHGGVLVGFGTGSHTADYPSKNLVFKNIKATDTIQRTGTSISGGSVIKIEDTGAGALDVGSIIMRDIHAERFSADAVVVRGPNIRNLELTDSTFIDNSGTATTSALVLRDVDITGLLVEDNTFIDITGGAQVWQEFGTVTVEDKHVNGNRFYDCDNPFDNLLEDPTAYAEIYVTGNTNTQAVANATNVQITDFDTNGVYHQCTPDHTNDHITIDQSGTYDVSCCMGIIGDVNAEFDFQIYINDGATAKPSLISSRNFSNATDLGSMAIGGMAYFDDNDTVELWVSHDQGISKTITVQDAVLGVKRIG